MKIYLERLRKHTAFEDSPEKTLAVLTLLNRIEQIQMIDPGLLIEAREKFPKHEHKHLDEFALRLNDFFGKRLEID